MAKKSSFLLAVLFIANPFVLLFYQNCSMVPKSHSSVSNSEIAAKKLSPNEAARLPSSIENKK